MPARDDFPGAPGRAIGVESAANSAEAVTPHDVNELVVVSRALYFGVGGTATVVMRDGTQIQFIGIVAGSILPLRVKQVRATGTTATSIVALR